MAPRPPAAGGGGRRHRSPSPPPPPGRGGGGKGKGGRNKGDDAMRRNRIDMAVTGLRNALMQQGLDPQSAYSFARMALSQKGVQIARNGKVHYKNSIYSAQDFANSPLIKYVTGAKAKAANQAAILADPNYQMALSQLGLARDQSQAALDAQRRQATLDFGDPSFIQNDPVLAAAAAANKFSTTQALQDQYAQQQRTVRNTANSAGTLFGGGQVSGQQQATHIFAGQQQEATSAIQNLLNSLSMQSSQLGQNYSLGQQNALLQTQQNLTAQGMLSKSGPKLKVNPFKLYNPRQPKRPRQPRGAGGGGGIGPPSGSHPIGSPISGI